MKPCLPPPGNPAVPRLTAMQSFVFTVPNRPPMPVDAIPADTIHVGDSVTFDLSSYFDDPDGDTLTYAATASDSGVAGVSMPRRPTRGWPRPPRRAGR